MAQEMSVDELRRIAALHKGMTPESWLMDWAAGEIDAVMAELTERRASGDTCGRVCEGTAYRIAARQEKARAEAIAVAAQAVVDRWDTPQWKDVPATAEYINRLRNAIAHNDRVEGRSEAERPR